MGLIPTKGPTYTSEKGKIYMPKILNTVTSFKDLQAGDIVINKNGGKYFIPGIPGNGAINSDGKFTVFTENFKNPHSKTDGGLDAVTVVRLDATPGIELMSEAIRYVMLNVTPKYPSTTVWSAKSPAVLQAERDLADATAAADAAAARLSAAKAKLARVR